MTDMRDAHDPAALVRHAAEAGDWRLVELVARMLSGHADAARTTAQRAYATLVLKLGLAGETGVYHRG
jgi:hypothetical protein